MSIQLSTLDLQSWRVIILSGRIDAFNDKRVIAAMKAQIREQDKTLALDLTKLEFINIIALKELLETAKLMRERGGEMVLVAPNATVRRHLESFAGNKNLRIFQDLEELQLGFCFQPRSEFAMQGFASRY